MVEFGLEVYGGHGRTCVRAWFFYGDWRKLYLSLSEMVDLEMSSVCILGSWRREWSVPVCAVRYMVSEETRSLSVCRGCSLICFLH